MMAWILFVLSCGLLYWVYDGYGRCLQLVVRLQSLWHRLRGSARAAVPAAAPHWPSLTVLLTVHNEEAHVLNRIRNLLDCDYPREQLQILVASDGSTDSTNALVETCGVPQVQLLLGTGQGKTSTQNAAVARISSEIVVFTDAETVFDRDFLRQVAVPFADPRVGAVAGHLRFADSAGNCNVRSQGFYWNYELKLRELESRLGLLAVLAGAAFAVRRSLIRPMNPAIGDDCIVPLDVVDQGCRVVHQPTALAWDRFAEDSGTTLRSRTRMTLRNWQGTWTRPQLLNPLRHPGYAFALWSHKLLRWLSPVFLLTAVLSAVWLTVFQPGVWSAAALAPFALLLSLGGLGAAGGRLPGAGVAFSFLIANTAFLMGLIRVARGNRVCSYRNV